MRSPNSTCCGKMPSGACRPVVSMHQRGIFAPITSCLPSSPSSHRVQRQLLQWVSRTLIRRQCTPMETSRLLGSVSLFLWLSIMVLSRTSPPEQDPSVPRERSPRKPRFSPKVLPSSETFLSWPLNAPTAGRPRREFATHRCYTCEEGKSQAQAVPKS